MKKISFKKITFLVLAVSTCIKCATTEKINNQNFDKIKADFMLPKDDNTLWCYWYWIGDDISKDGITKDLEAMKNQPMLLDILKTINLTTITTKP